MGSVGKVTLSLPAELLARIEERRLREGVTRSEAVTALLWRAWRETENEARVARYRAAYAAQPETGEELAFAEAAAAELFRDDEPWQEDAPQAPSATMAPAKKAAAKKGTAQRVASQQAAGVQRTETKGRRVKLTKSKTGELRFSVEDAPAVKANSRSSRRGVREPG